MVRRWLSGGVYLALSAAVVCWWALAFRASSAPVTVSHTQAASVEEPLSFLSPLSRDELHAALAGDASLMLRLIERWQIDAACLTETGFTGMASLPIAYVAEARSLARQLETPSEGDFLPLSHTAAAFLLSLVPTSQIAALPEGFRAYHSLFSPEQLDAIPLTTSRFHSELFAQRKPHAAFVASYSHPSTVAALKNQGIPTVSLPDLQVTADFTPLLEQLGKATGQENRAKLLDHFIQAAMLAMDNRLAVLSQGRKAPPLRVLTVQAFDTFSLPTKKTFTGHLVSRLEKVCVCLHAETLHNGMDWAVPITSEAIQQANPDCLLLSSYGPAHLEQTGIPDLACWKKDTVFVLDREIQDFPSPYLVLAYYDFYHALSSAFTKV